MKKATKLIAIISIVAMLAVSFAACGGQDDRKEHDGKEFTYWASMDSQTVRAKLESYDDMLMFQELEKRTGVHINFQHPVAGSDGNEAFIGMINSDNRAELVEYKWGGYPGGPQQAIDDGIIIALNDYLKDYAPNFYACVEGDADHFIFKEGLATTDGAKLWKLQASTDKGDFYGFNVLNIGDTRGFGGLYVRGDLLKKWGMDIPKNIDDWTAVFAKAKAEGFEKPFTCSLDTLSFKSYSTESFNTGFGVGKAFYIEDDKVVFAPFQPGYKEYTAQIADWMKAGYIDSGFATNESETIKSNVTNGISVASWGWIGGDLGTITPAAQTTNPEFELVACPLPAEADGTPAQYQMTYPEATDVAIAITYNCGNYEKAMEWVDYRYSKEGAELNIFGVEGDTFTKEETDERTVYTYTDKITNPDPAKFNSVEEALYYYMLPCNHPGFNQHPDYLQGYYPYQAQKDAVITWNEASEASKKHAIPTLSFTQEENEQIADAQEIAEAPLEAALCNIMLGKASIDTYDAAIEAAKPQYEKWIAIQQAAYDRYLSKLDN